MPHVVIQYTQNLEAQVDMPALCRDVADTLIEQRDEKGGPLYPVGGTRVLAYPAAGLRSGRRQGRLWLLLHQHPHRRGSQRR